MKIFEAPVMEIEKFEIVDVITTSGDDEWNGDNGDNNTGWN